MSRDSDRDEHAQPLPTTQRTETAQPPQRRSTTSLVAPLHENAHLRHPLTVLVVLFPIAILAEIYRWLADSRETLLADAALTELGGLIGADRPLLTILVLVVGCLTVQIIGHRSWQWPDLTTLLQVGAWALIWALVRTVIGFTGDTLLIDASLPLDPLASTPGEELSLLGHVGLAMSGALQEELLFRAGLIGGLAWLLTPLRLQHTHAQLLLLLPAAAIFALAHTDVVNHYHVAQPFSWPLVIQHGLGGLLYGIVFIRQGLAVCTLSHGCYNGAVAFGLLDF